MENTQLVNVIIKNESNNKEVITFKADKESARKEGWNRLKEFLNVPTITPFINNYYIELN